MGSERTKKNKEKKRKERRRSPPPCAGGLVSRFRFLGGTILAHLPGPMYLRNISQDPRAESAFPKLREELQQQVLS